MENTEKEKIVIITGLSGAGKSHVANALEDMGFFCIDNLPPDLFGKFAEGLQLSSHVLPKLAIVADIRSGAESLPQMETYLHGLRASGLDICIIFLEASDATIVRRYKENRRPHPLAQQFHSISDCIAEERALLTNLRGMADVVIDTTDISNREMALRLNQLFGSKDGKDSISLVVTSFGFKYGLPIDADMVVDVRFLPNPFYMPALKELTGLDKPVAKYVLRNEMTRGFLSRLGNLLRFAMPGYQKEGKRHFSLAVGCTGGCHRSVSIAEEIGKRMRKAGYPVSINHRDLKHRNTR